MFEFLGNLVWRLVTQSWGWRQERESIDHYHQVVLRRIEEQLGALQDHVCKHLNLEDLGMQPGNWRELRCLDCGKRMAVGCVHGGSIACDDCVRQWIANARTGEPSLNPLLVGK